MINDDESPKEVKEIQINHVKCSWNINTRVELSWNIFIRPVIYLVWYGASICLSSELEKCKQYRLNCFGRTIKFGTLTRYGERTTPIDFKVMCEIVSDLAYFVMYAFLLLGIRSIMQLLTCYFIHICFMNYHSVYDIKKYLKNKQAILTPNVNFISLWIL